MSFATDEEIKIAHDILLKGKIPFDEYRVDIIKANNSCYVQACPGSGKTTALLAKLVILANKMPLPEGKGVCVLTHTNVAIDEIKAKLGQKSDVLFRYPNFFGTIQTFVHKYVTAAALHYFYGSQIAYVDDDIAKAILLKKYYKLCNDNKLKKLINAHIISKKHEISADEIQRLGGVELLTKAKIIKNIGKKVVKYNFQLIGYELENISRIFQSLIRERRDKIFENQGKEILLSFRADWPNNKIITDNGSISMTSESGVEYKKIKEEMFREGILSFDDAYDLAFRYIREKKLDFSSFSDKRFQYLFIDEVQDCNNKQIDFIKHIFADDKVIVQRFGDYCQAIYEGDESNGNDNEELKGEHLLYIHDSNRFGENIAKPLRTLCMEDNNQLVGDEIVPSVKPIIITYKNPLSVLPKYVELLSSTLIPEKGNMSVLKIANKERQEDPLHRVNVKACGWVGKKGATEQKRFIESYFPAFERKNVRTRTEGDSIDDFILINPHSAVKDYATSIIQGILKFLDLCDVKNGNRRYTRTSLLESLTTNSVDKKEEFLNKVMNWALLLVKRNIKDIYNVRESIYQYVTTTLLPLYEKNVTQSANTFIKALGQKIQENQVVEYGNIYHNNNIDIEIATVHAVKGETHASTLYLETSYYGLHESERLSEQFKGVTYKGEDEKTFRSLRVVYVGMSRSHYMLCVAIQKDRFDKIDCLDLRKIWDVVEA